MERECKTLNLDECRTRADCSTRKKPKSDDLMCFKKPVRAPKQDMPPALVRKAAVAPKAPRMTAAHKAELRDDRPKLAFGKNGSFCVGMTEKDCGKAKVACQWTEEATDGTKAHCGRRPHGTKADMDALRKFNTFNYEKYGDDSDEDDEKYGEPIVNPRRSANDAAHKAAILEKRAKLPFVRNSSKGSFCVGMTEKDCGKAKVACHWIKASADGKREAHCGRRVQTDYDMDSVENVNSKSVAYAQNGGKSDPVLRLFYGY